MAYFRFFVACQGTGEQRFCGRLCPLPAETLSNKIFSHEFELIGNDHSA
jgi:hypothetical protein